MHNTYKPYKFRAFISYSHADKRWAQWLHRRLESYRVPQTLIGSSTPLGPVPDRIAPIFKDREEFATKADLGTAVQEALSDALFLIVICSPNAAASRWVNEEVARFKSLRDPAHVLCLLVDGDPGATPGSPQNCFPESLRTRLDDQGAEVMVEPLAADVRKSGDGKRGALLKLGASLLGVDYDQLQQRESVRRQRRMALITASSVAGLVLTTGLAVSAVLARQEAERQSALAALEAETANRTSAFMVDLFKVNDPGESRGNSITAKEILERGRSRIGNELRNQPRIRQRLMLTMGEVYTGLGLYDDAEAILTDAATHSSTSITDIESLQVQVALGNAEYLLGNYESAKHRLQRVLEDVDSNELPWTKTRSDAHLSLAATLVETDELEAAAAHYRLALNADQAHWQADDPQIGKSYSGLGTVLLYQGEYAQAEAALQTALKIFVNALGQDHPLTVVALNNLSNTYYFTRQFELTKRTLRQLIPIYRRLLGDQHPELATVLNNLGRVYLELGELDQAERALVESVAIDRALGRERHIDLVFSLNSLGVTQIARSELEAAAATFQEAAATFQEAAALAAGSEHRLLGPILAYQAELLCRSDAAREQWQPLLEQATSLVVAAYGADHWRNALMDSIRGYCLVTAGNLPEGRLLLETSANTLKQEFPGGFFAKRAARLSKLNAGTIAID